MSALSPRHAPAASPALVIGTAGHIDHGKSALVHALTGIDPDRLEEEKRRGMTIDLGFAHLDLPNGRRAGIVDVPGHERLIRTMLAGAGGVDLVLLVVAADEGVMPQTREHLDILRFVGPRAGLLVLSKIDLATDEEWLTLLEEELHALTAGTFLEEAPIIRTSARTGVGLAALVDAIAKSLDTLPEHQAEGTVRLPVDRVFTMAGFGTVVTGTLWSGRIRPGDSLAVLPGGLTARVRQVEQHGERVEEVSAGSRAALNLAGIERSALRRGAVLATPGSLRETTLLDVQVRLLAASPALPHRARLRFYLGTDEALCRIMLLDRDRLAPGEEAAAQLLFERPVVAARGDRFVLRRYSPLLTLGGGSVVVVDPPRRRRGGASAAALAALAGASPDPVLVDAVARLGLRGGTVEALSPVVGESPSSVAARAEALVAAGTLIRVGLHLFDRTVVEAASQHLLRLLEAVHAEHPWRLGLPREEVKQRVVGEAAEPLAAALLDRLVGAGHIAVTRGFVHRADHRPAFSAEVAGLRSSLLDAISAGRFAPPSLDQLSARMEDTPGPQPGRGHGRQAAFAAALQSLQEEGALVEVGPGILFAASVLDEIRRGVAAAIEETGAVTVASLRDRLGTSRRYALALLEYFDGIRLTRRVGDRRVLAGSAR